jgi:hypothetical protein
MKKIFIYTLLSCLFLIACEPVEDSKELTGSITADEIVATVKAEVADNGKTVNKVILDCSSPILCKWSNGVESAVGAHAELKMFALGEQTITLTGLCKDGTFITRDYTVNIEEMKYEIEPQYAYFCGDGEKKWTWDSQVAKPWGNGGYGNDMGPAWWCMSPEEIDADIAGNNRTQWLGEGVNATMTFVLNGMKLIKSSGKEGTFHFDMTQKITKTDANGNVVDWSIGKLYTNGTDVLFGMIANDWTSATEYDILVLDDQQMVLAAPCVAGAGWNEGTFWCFRAINE